MFTIPVYEVLSLWALTRLQPPCELRSIRIEQRIDAFAHGIRRKTIGKRVTPGSHTQRISSKQPERWFKLSQSKRRERVEGIIPLGQPVTVLIRSKRLPFESFFIYRFCDT